jgi:carbonic anhydrase/acetyltransferase-like protein (isoleucine patch superfamily)
MNTKFEFVAGDTITAVHGVTLTRIRALRDIPEAKVKSGDLGGYLQSEENLHEEGACWVGDNARVFGEAMVFCNARIFGQARISGDAKIFGDALVFGDAQVSGEALVFGKTKIFGNAMVFDRARIYGSASIFGSARVSGRTTRVYEKAQIFGDARVFGNARVFGEAWVSGGAQVSGEASISPICISGFRWTVTLTDKHMRIECQFHEVEAWGSFTNEEIVRMDRNNALNLWQEHRDWLMTQARAHAKKAAEAKSKVQ